MAQNEKFNRQNFGGDDYYDMNNKKNFYYDDNDYKLKRYKREDSIIVRKDNKDGKIVDILIDVGLSHHQHGVTQDLDSDRLFLNKMDNHHTRIDDMRDIDMKAPRDNFTAKDFANRIYRVGKMVDRDVFHDQLGYTDIDHRMDRVYSIFDWHRKTRERGE